MKIPILQWITYYRILLPFEPSVVISTSPSSIRERTGSSKPLFLCLPTRLLPGLKDTLRMESLTRSSCSGKKDTITHTDIKQAMEPSHIRHKYFSSSYQVLVPLQHILLKMKLVLGDIIQVLTMLGLFQSLQTKHSYLIQRNSVNCLITLQHDVTFTKLSQCFKISTIRLQTQTLNPICEAKDISMGLDNQCMNAISGKRPSSPVCPGWLCCPHSLLFNLMATRGFFLWVVGRVAEK